ncbi:MAG: hypothetical protein AAFP19_01160 [Bacteroidota bacterium]
MPLTSLNHLNLANGQFDQTSREELAQLFVRLREDEQKDKHLMIHFHGGLVNQKHATKVIENTLLPAHDLPHSYPIFFIWQSGFIDVLRNNLSEITQERIFKLLRKRILNFVLSKIKKKLTDGLEEITTKGFDSVYDELEVNEDTQQIFADYEGHLEEVDEVSGAEKFLLEEELRTDQELELECKLIAGYIQDQVSVDDGSKGVRVRANTKTLMEPSMFMEVNTAAEATGSSKGILTFGKIIKEAVKVAIKVIRRYRKKTHHGLYPTIFEEICRTYYLANAGKLLWTTMKKDTRDAFQADGQRYGGTAFLEELNQHWKEGHRPEITLVGHSAGSVYICHLLEAAAQLLDSDIRFNIIFMAPACTMDLFATTIEQYGERMNQVRLFSMSDELEKKDKLLSFIYPRSLLYLVAGLAEEEIDQPLLGMQRYFMNKPPYQLDKNPSIKTCIDYLSGKEESLIWSLYDGGDGKRCTAEKHGAFDDDDPNTLKSVQYLIKTNDYS